jgi:ribosome-associated toxin RatA of RatAB toxin-antitoxin module
VRSTIAIEVDAPPAAVWSLARDVTRWQALLPHYGRSRLVRRDADDRSVVAFVARRPLPGVLGAVGLGIPVAWRSRCWSMPAEPGGAGPRLRFVHVAGVTRGMDVTWRIEPTSTGCRITIEHDFEPRLPGLARSVDRWFTRAIAGRTLATFKALAEAVTAPEVSVARPPTTDDA